MDRSGNDQRLELALTAGRLGTWEFDLATGTLTSSAQCKANHGFGADEDLQLETHVIPAIAPDHRDAFRALIDRAIAGGGGFEIEVPNVWPDGSLHWLLVAGRLLDGGRLVGITQDITERRSIEQALRDVDRQKDEFLAVLGHELRGPLGAIVTAVRLLQLKGPPDPQLQKLRDTIQRQALQVWTLVDDLLDVERIVNGKLRLERTRVELGAVVKQAVETCAPLVERRRHTLTVALPDVPVYVDGDAARLVQVLSNLLNNAAKYQHEGGRIDLSAFEDEGAAVIRVRDEGLGIPPDMLARIFQRFVQVRSSEDRSEGGLGLGLSLVKALVDLHGGCVDVESEGIGKGSRFTVRLPTVPVSLASA